MLSLVTTAVKEILAAAGVDCAALRCNRNEILLRLKTLETDFGESLKIEPEKTIKRFG